MAITPEQARAELARRELQRRGVTETSSIEQPQQGQGIDVGSAVGLLLGGGALAGAGYGVKKGVDYFAQPKVRKELKGVTGELTGIQRELNIPTTQQEYIPQEIKFIRDQENLNKARMVSDVKQNADFSANALKNQINVLDETLISLSTDDLAKTIKVHAPQVFRDASEAYSSGLDAVDMYFNENAKPITAKKYASFLDDVIGDLYKRGVPQNEIRSLEIARDGIVPSEDYIIPFRQAKGEVSSLVKQSPYSATSSRLRYKWGQFLENNAPSEVQTYLKDLNGKFKNFAELRTTMLKAIDPKTGEFEHKKLNEMFLRYVKQRRDDEVVEMMKVLGEGTPITRPIPSAKEKFSALTSLREKRSGIISTQRDVATSTKNQLYYIEEQLRPRLDKINELDHKAQILISTKKELREKLDSRKVGSILSKTFGLGRVAGKVLGAIPNIWDAYIGISDPERYLYRQVVPGEDLSPKGSLERKIQLGQVA